MFFMTHIDNTSCKMHFYLPTSMKFDYQFVKVGTLKYEIEDITIGEIQSDMPL